MRKLTAGVLVGLALVGLAGCRGKPAGTGIGVFVPGVMSGSPIYEMLAQGTQRAVDEWGIGSGKIETAVVEGGYNQAEWEPKLTAMAASKRYALIVSSNPSLPAIVSSISAKFPAQKFLLLDGELAGNPSVYSMRYDQREQGYMAGYIAGLEAQEMAGETGGDSLDSGGSGAKNGEKRIGLIAGQEYPAMNDVILPAYREGAQAVDPAFGVDFRVLGNWFDAGKAAEIAADMIRGGARVILCVAGGANEGIVQAAAENNAKVVWMDTNGYMVRPGIVVGSAVVYQNKAAYEKVKLFLEGKLPFGTAETKGVADGYVDFVQDDPNYIKFVSEAVREKQAAMVERLRNGDLW